MVNANRLRVMSLDKVAYVDDRCRVCSAKSTIRAHLIPQAFAREVRDGDKHLALTAGASLNFRPTQNGLFDATLLCAKCDNKLGTYEKYCFETLGSIRKASFGKINQHVAISPVEPHRLIRFAAGLCWKYANTKAAYGRIDIGPYV